jgi:NADH:ubiquinone oxidoreductase subunit 5 (subunit L)/multisubunit Na+/H+ antiporter MnhA subunit
MTLSGTDGSANLLIIAYSTHSALALMVMRCAANLPIDAADRDKNAFATAGSILRVAQQQLVSGVY